MPGRQMYRGLSCSVPRQLHLACGAARHAYGAANRQVVATHWQAVAFAFGLIAFLYLVTEELLTEAHKNPETAWGAASFFVGFLALTVLNQVI